MTRPSRILLAASVLLAAAPAAFAANGDRPDATQQPTVARQAAPDTAARSGYGAQPRTAVEAGRRAQDPFTINGRSMYDVH